MGVLNKKRNFLHTIYILSKKDFKKIDLNLKQYLNYTIQKKQNKYTKMEYAVVSYKNTGYNLRSSKSMPARHFYRHTEEEPEMWSNLIGLYSTKAEAIAEFEREATKNRKWIQLVSLESREIIRSQEVYEYYVVGRI